MRKSLILLPSESVGLNILHRKATNTLFLKGAQKKTQTCKPIFTNTPSLFPHLSPAVGCKKACWCFSLIYANPILQFSHNGVRLSLSLAHLLPYPLSVCSALHLKNCLSPLFVWGNITSIISTSPRSILQEYTKLKAISGVPCCLKKPQSFQFKKYSSSSLFRTKTST